MDRRRCLFWLLMGTSTALAACGPSKAKRAQDTAQLIATSAASSRGSDINSCPTLEELERTHALQMVPSIVDPWGERFRIACTLSIVTITSLGPDRIPFTADDIHASATGASRPPVAATGVGTATETPETSDAAAKDTASIIRATHPFACRAAAADWKWATCQDDSIGFDALLKCAEQASASTTAQASAFRGPSATSACGGVVAQATERLVMAMAAYLRDTVTWLKAHRAEVAPRMIGKNIGDACEDNACPRPPMGGIQSPYPDATYAIISGIECTKPMFRCGSAVDNVCWINKVAARLGVACDPEENKAGDPLTVRASGTRIR